MTTSRFQGWTTLCQAGVIFLAVFCVYFPALTGDFIWDDRTYIINSSLINAADGLHRIWLSREMTDFWPLSYSLYWYMLRVFGSYPLGYHLIGVGLHIASVFLLWRLLQILQLKQAFFAAFLFAVHPVCVESVAWIIEVKTTLASVLALGSAILFVESRTVKDWRYGTSLLCFGAAMIAKAAVAPLPIVLLLLKHWQEQRSGLEKKDLIRVAPFFAVALLMTALNIHWYAQKNLFDIPSEAIRDDSLASRLAIGGKAFWFYLAKALVPTHLAFIYPRWPVNDPPALLDMMPGSAMVLGIVGLALCARKDRRYLGPACVAMAIFAMLAPVLGVYDVYQMRYTFVTDHWQYFALMGSMVALAEGGSFLLRNAYHLRIFVFSVLATIFAWLAFEHAKNFRDEETIWRATLRENPDSWMVHKTLGLVLKLQGRHDEAESAYRESIRLKPQAETLYNLAIILEGRQRFAEARDLYLEALTLNSYHWAIYNNLGSVQVRLGFLDQAALSFEKSLKLQPSAIGHYNLGLILQEQGAQDAAYAHYLKAESLANTPGEKDTINKKLRDIHADTKEKHQF